MVVNYTESTAHAPNIHMILRQCNRSAGCFSGKVASEGFSNPMNKLGPILCYLLSALKKYCMTLSEISWKLGNCGSNLASAVTAVYVPNCLFWFWGRIRQSTVIVGGDGMVV